MQINLKGLKRQTYDKLNFGFMEINLKVVADLASKFFFKKKKSSS